MWIAWMLAGCSLTPCECGPSECVDACSVARADEPHAKVPVAASAEPALTAFEQSHMMPLLDDIRAGVRPWNANAISICPKGEPHTCPEALGATVGKLPAGEFILHAELRVPNVGEKGTWTIHYSQECTTTRASSNGTTTSSRTYENDYTVEYINEERGARLSPLARIASPSPHGHQHCTYTITAPHPDGAKIYTGEWRVPGPG